MTDETANLPGLYELVTVERTDSARAHAERLARDGAEEGTIVWAKSQSEGLGRAGNFWMSGARNLHCAVILRPEDTFATCCQLSLLATISAALAVSRQAEPLEELRYRWPNDVLLNRGKLAGIGLSGECGDEDRVEWMVVSLNVNAYEHPGSRGFAAASMRGEGFESYDRVRLLEAYSRELLSWLNRWSSEGFAPVRRAWLTRGQGDDETICLRIDRDHYEGRVRGLDEDGALRLEQTHGKTSTLSLARFYAADFVNE